MVLVLPSDLTGAQSAMWLDQQLLPEKPIYNTGQFLTIRGPLRLDLFEQALRETIEECPGLQLPPWTFADFDLTNLDFRDKDDPVAAAEQWMQENIREPIPLESAALARFALIRVSGDRTIWFQKFHHITVDATSRWLVSARTAARYRALRFGEPLAAFDPITPQELLDAERRYAASKDHETDRRYWLELFADWSGPLIENSRQETERAKSGWSARIEFKLKRADFERLEAAARALNSSAARVIIVLAYAAFARLYDRYDLVLGIELAFRSDPRSKQATG
jgi:nonribosomal peptide synthetase DhbF